MSNTRFCSTKRIEGCDVHVAKLAPSCSLGDTIAAFALAIFMEVVDQTTKRLLKQLTFARLDRIERFARERLVGHNL